MQDIDRSLHVHFLHIVLIIVPISRIHFQCMLEILTLHYVGLYTRQKCYYHIVDLATQTMHTAVVAMRSACAGWQKQTILEYAGSG